MGKDKCLEYNVSRGVREERPSLQFVKVALLCIPTFLLTGSCMLCQFM